MTEPRITLDAAIRANYRRTVSEGPSAEGISKRSAAKRVVELTREQHRCGELIMPDDALDQLFKLSLDKIDEQEHGHTDFALQRLSEGQAPITFEDDDLLSSVVRIGKGMRKPMRFLVADDVANLLNEKEEARRKLTEHIEEIRPAYELIIHALTHDWVCLGDAVEAGAFGVPALPV